MEPRACAATKASICCLRLPGYVCDSIEMDSVMSDNSTAPYEHINMLPRCEKKRNPAHRTGVIYVRRTWSKWCDEPSTKFACRRHGIEFTWNENSAPLHDCATEPTD